MVAKSGIGTPKLVGEMPKGQRGVERCGRDVLWDELQNMACSNIYVHPSSHFVLLAYRLRGANTSCRHRYDYPGAYAPGFDMSSLQDFAGNRRYLNFVLLIIQDDEDRT